MGLLANIKFLSRLPFRRPLPTTSKNISNSHKTPITPSAPKFSQKQKTKRAKLLQPTLQSPGIWTHLPAKTEAAVLVSGHLKLAPRCQISPRTATQSPVPSSHRQFVHSATHPGTTYENEQSNPYRQAPYHLHTEDYRLQTCKPIPTQVPRTLLRLAPLFTILDRSEPWSQEISTK